jgi:hypothetical protein
MHPPHILYIYMLQILIKIDHMTIDNAVKVSVTSSKKTQQNSRCPDEEATSHHHARPAGVGRGRGVATTVAVVLAAAGDCPGVQHGRRPQRTMPTTVAVSVAMAVRASSGDGDGVRRPFRPRSSALLVTSCVFLEKRCRHCRCRLLLLELRSSAVVRAAATRDQLPHGPACSDDGRGKSTGEERVSLVTCMENSLETFFRERELKEACTFAATTCKMFNSSKQTVRDSNS